MEKLNSWLHDFGEEREGVGYTRSRGSLLGIVFSALNREAASSSSRAYSSWLGQEMKAIYFLSLFPRLSSLSLPATGVKGALSGRLTERERPTFLGKDDDVISRKVCFWGWSTSGRERND